MGQATQQTSAEPMGTPSEIARFYFEENGYGKMHWEYMDKSRMAEVFIQLAPRLDRESQSRRKIEDWLKKHIN